MCQRSLKKEKYFYDASINGYEESNRDKKSLFIERVEAQISNAHIAWLSTHQPKEEEES